MTNYDLVLWWCIHVFYFIMVSFRHEMLVGRWCFKYRLLQSIAISIFNTWSISSLTRIRKEKLQKWKRALLMLKNVWEKVFVSLLWTLWWPEMVNFHSLSNSLSLSLSLTHTRTHSHTHTQVRTGTYTCTLSLSLFWFLVLVLASSFKIINSFFDFSLAVSSLIPASFWLTFVPVWSRNKILLGLAFLRIPNKDPDLIWPLKILLEDCPGAYLKNF